MRIGNRLILFFALFAFVATVGCTENSEPTPTPKPTPDTPTAQIVKGEVTATTASFTITTTFAEAAAYILYEATESEPAASAVIADGVAVEANKSVEITVTELVPDTEYRVVAAAKSGDNTVASKPLIIKTLAQSDAPIVKPTVTLTAGEVTETTLSFTLVTTQAADVAYLCQTASEEAPDGDKILAEGVATEANTEKVITVDELMPDTEYTIYAAARNDDYLVEAEAITMATLVQRLPVEFSASVTDDISYDYIVLSITAENVDGLRVVCFPAGERDVTFEQAYKNGSDVPIGGEQLIPIPGLEPETEYEIIVTYVVDGEYDGIKLYATTLKEVITYRVAATSASTAHGSGSNIFVSFDDPEAKLQMKVDFYTSTPYDYLMPARYELKAANADYYFSPYYTTLILDSSTLMPIVDGYVDVVAEPNEETREVCYEISGEFTSENGDYVVVLDYEGIIEGIQMPAYNPDVPEGAYVFEVTSLPERYTGNVVAGEYYIKFSDVLWNELALDIKVDPAICNDGNDPLPAGSYSLADGTIDPYTYATFYNPYSSNNFAEAEVTVERDGLDYTITFLGTDTAGKLIYMRYEGEIKNMVK